MAETTWCFAGGPRLATSPPRDHPIEAAPRPPLHPAAPLFNVQLGSAVGGRASCCGEAELRDWNIFHTSRLIRVAASAREEASFFHTTLDSAMPGVPVPSHALQCLASQDAMMSISILTASQ